MHRLTLISLICLILGSCARDRAISDTLAHADRLIFEAPDSAVAILDSIRLDNASGFQLARHSLLLAKAREKAGIVVTDTPADSVLSSSIESLSDAAWQFRNRGDSLEAQTLFYLGVLLGYRGDYSEALISLMESADISKNTGDHFYLAMAYREQADIYTDLYAFEQAAKFGKLASEVFLQANRPLHAAWEQVSLIQTLSYSDNSEEGTKLIDKLLNDSIIQSDAFLKRRVYLHACELSIKLSDVDRAEKYFNAFLKEGGKPSSKLYAAMTRIRLKSADTDNAKQFYLKAISNAEDETDSLAAKLALAQLQVAESDFQQAYLNQTKVYYQLNTRENRLITHPYTSLLSEHYHTKSIEQTIQKQAAQQRVWISILVIILLILFSCVLFLYYRKRLLRKELEIEHIFADMQSLQIKLESLTKQEGQNNKNPRLATLPATLLNSLCKSRYILSPGDKGYKDIGKITVDFIDTIKSSDILHDLEQYIDSTNNRLMARFREQISDLPSSYYNLALLTFIGFSNDSICCVLKIGEGSARNARSKIRTKINSSDCPDKEIFLKFFQKIRG